jgi:hypothetical protein
MLLYVRLFRAKREGLSSRNNDILKKNIDILKLEDGKAGSPIGLEPQRGTYSIICKAGTPAHFDRTECMFQLPVRTDMMFDRNKQNPTVNVNG